MVIDPQTSKQTIFIQRRPGGLFQYTEGEEVKICLASTLSSIQAIFPNRVRRRAWIISVSRGWLKTPGKLAVSKSMECDIFPFSALTLLVG